MAADACSGVTSRPRRSRSSTRRCGAGRSSSTMVPSASSRIARGRFSFAGPPVLASASMGSETLGALLGVTVSDDQRRWIVAVLAVGLALIAAWAVDRTFARRGRGLAEAVVRGELSPEANTRLRFVRRLLTAAIIVFGLA